MTSSPRESKGSEEVTEYRVVDERRPWRVVYAESSQRARAYASNQRPQHRIESRTVTYSPWREL